MVLQSASEINFTAPLCKHTQPFFAAHIFHLLLFCWWLQVVRHTIVYEDPDDLLGAVLRSSGLVSFLFMSGLVTFNYWVGFSPMAIVQPLFCSSPHITPKKVLVCHAHKPCLT
jgi:hypothetical protein